jgi:HK97 family phage portal protein
MGIFGRFFGNKKSAMTSGELFLELLQGSEAVSGAYVNTRTALECTTVLACVRVIANGLAQVPFKVFRHDGRERVPAYGHSLFDLIDVAPSDYQTSFEFRQEIAMHLALTGNAFVFVNRLGGRIIELLPYPPGCVTMERNGWDVKYTIADNNDFKVDIPPENMWHIRWLPWNGIAGMEAVKVAREAVGLSLATEKHGAKLFANGGRPGGMLSTDEKLSQEQVDMLKANWQAAHGGGNSFKTAVLFGGMKYTPVSSNNDNAQFLETRRHQVEEVCRAFGVLPIMVGHYDKASTYASSEQMFLQHGVHTLGPWYSCIEKSATRWLLTKEERRGGYYLKFNANGLMRGAAKDRAEYYTKLYGVGALSPNDIRELEDMNPYDGGDEYRVPLNMAEPGSELGDSKGSPEEDNG